MQKRKDQRCIQLAMVSMSFLPEPRGNVLKFRMTWFLRERLDGRFVSTERLYNGVVDLDVVVDSSSDFGG